MMFSDSVLSHQQAEVHRTIVVDKARSKNHSIMSWFRHQRGRSPAALESQTSRRNGAPISGAGGAIPLKRTPSWERNLHPLPRPKDKSKRRNFHASSLNVETLQQQPRDVQRAAILKYLNRDTYVPAGEKCTRNLSDGEQAEVLVATADTLQASGELVFNRFERLCILDILRWQHEIVEIYERIQFGDEDQKVKSLEIVYRAIQRYVEAIEAFQKLSNLKQPGFQASYDAGGSLAVALHEPRYWDSPDALNVFDLSPLNQDSSIDRIRLWLQRVVPSSFLDIWGKERREIDKAAAKLPQPAPKTAANEGHILEDIGPKETNKVIASYRQRPHHISPAVDIATRILVAIVGGLLVLVPIAVLSYITDFKWVLFVTFAFTIVFSVGLSIMSRASNDQIIMATAAYGAVLVVFVANILTEKAH